MALTNRESIYKCLKNGRHLESEVNSNEYYMTRRKIIVLNKEKQVIKKIELPQMENNERVIGFYDMYYDCGELLVVISMRDYYDSKTILNEKTLELGALSPYK